VEKGEHTRSWPVLSSILTSINSACIANDAVAALDIVASQLHSVHRRYAYHILSPQLWAESSVDAQTI
jgi:hypothetical protein